jgi:hypothetical protein
MIFAASVGSQGAGVERYAAYVPFVLSPGRDIAIEEPVSFPMLAYTAHLEKLHHLYAISVGPFPQPEQARKFIASIKASLMWLSLNYRVGISYPKDISDVELFDEPVRIADKGAFKELMKTAGWDVADGHYDADKIVVRPEHKKLSRWEMGNATVRLRIGTDNAIGCLGTAVDFPYLDQVHGSDKLQLAIELYGASSFELTENAKLITLVTSLESLVPNVEVSSCVQHCLRETINLMKKKRDSYARESADRKEVDQLLTRVGQLRFQSIGSALRTYVSTIVEGAGDLGDSDKVAARLRKVYDLRSRLLHEGIAD